MPNREKKGNGNIGKMGNEKHDTDCVRVFWCVLKDLLT